MKRIIFAIALIAAAGTSAAAGPCLDSAQAVWAHSPRAHATWNLVDGVHGLVRCWRAGYPHHGKLAHAYGWAPTLVPLPRPRPDFEILYRAHYPRLTQEQGRALANDLFGSDELFGFQ